MDFPAFEAETKLKNGEITVDEFVKEWNDYLANVRAEYAEPILEEMRQAKTKWIDAVKRLQALDAEFHKQRYVPTQALVDRYSRSISRLDATNRVKHSDAFIERSELQDVYKIC